MTKKEILAAITEWESHQKALDAQLDLLYDLVGCQPDSPLLTAIYKVTAGHTEAVSLLIGDENGWLSWWQFECEFGKKQMSAAKADGKFRQVTNIKQLAGLIAE